jgi:hypothetical protein
MSEVKGSRYAVLALLVLLATACGIVSSEGGDERLGEEGPELGYSQFNMDGGPAGFPPATPEELRMLRLQWLMQCMVEKTILCKEAKLSVQLCCEAHAKCPSEMPAYLDPDAGTSGLLEDGGMPLPSECTEIADGGAPGPDAGTPALDGGSPVPDGGMEPDAGS